MRLTTFIALPLLLAACGPSQADFDNLKRRTATLEKRVRALEGGSAKGAKGKRKGKGKAKVKAKNKIKAKAQADVARGTVQVDGDASKVFLSGPRRRFPVPGLVPVGEYAVLAKFADEEAPIQAGKVTVTADAILEIQCHGDTKVCKPGIP